MAPIVVYNLVLEHLGVFHDGATLSNFNGFQDNLFFHTDVQLLNISLPIGISFFTFTQIAFLVDSYRGLVRNYNILNYSLFVTYFPHLIAGPIIHHKEVMPQFENRKTFKFNYRNIVLGLTIFAIGLFKKSVMADYLGSIVGPIFDIKLQHITTIDAWSAALAYTLELYFDFSGYSDMAIGLSLLIGIKLPINFFSPYKSVNIIEFWRRWNMTLSRFLRDYVYIPLGGNRHGSPRRYLNLMITMLLGGLWHGANWTFVIWGCLHGIYLCINHGWIALKKYLGIGAVNGFLFTIFSRMLTFLAVVIAWVFFRSPDFSKSYQILYAMFFERLTLPNPWCIPNAVRTFLQKLNISFSDEHTLVASNKSIMLIFSALLIVWLLPNTYQVLRRYRPVLIFYHDKIVSNKKLPTWKPTLAWNFFISSFFVIGFLHIQSSSIFLYFRF